MKNSNLLLNWKPHFKLSLLDRYIIKEIILFFLFSVGLFSSLGVAVGTLSDLAYKVTEYNLPINTAVQVFFLSLPEFVAYAFPISVLLATLLTYGRLSADSELIALRSFGISIYRLITPVLLFSLVIALITFFFNEFIVPAANERAIVLQDKYIQSESSVWQKHNIFYPEYELIDRGDRELVKKIQRLFYAEKFDGKLFNNLIVLNWSANTLERIITCKTAQWNDSKNIWDCFQGKIEYLAERKTQYFAHQSFLFSEVFLTIAKQDIDPFEMNIFQAQNYLNIIQASGDRKKTLLFQVRIQQKIAFPFICLVFACIGSTIAISFQQINRARGFGLCVIIVFIYYLLAFIIGALGLVGILSPFLAAWIPNFLGFAMSGWLLINCNLD